MAWADLSVKDAELKGHAENLLTDRQSGSYDSGLATSEREDVARGHLETALMNAGLTSYIDNAGGPDQLLDNLEGDSTLKGRLEQGIALAFLAKFAEDDAVITSGRTAEREQDLQDDLEDWADSFVPIAAYQLGYTSTTESAGGGSFASTMDAYD